MAIVGVAMAALVGAGFASRGLLEPPVADPVRAAATTTAPPSGSSSPLVAGNDEEPVVAVAKALTPSVVLIKTGDGLGSGVVYDSGGLIMTNAHVIGDATDVEVHLHDGTTLAGTVVGSDANVDIAVIRVDPTVELVAARLATETPTVGQLAVGIGSPFGLDQTVTAGVVSAVDRPVDNGNGGVASLIQTDAPINPGNSGGALANRRGEVIGINEMIYSESGENNGIGFAIPIERAKSVADTLVSGGTVVGGYLGVQSAATEDGGAGAQLAKVESGSPAANGGLKVGDVVVSIDGKGVKQPSDLAAIIGSYRAGDTITVEIERNGSTTTVDVTLGAKSQPSTSSGSGSNPRSRPGG